MPHPAVPLPRCLIICPVSIVAEDLAEVIRERLGESAAEICLDPAAAIARLDELPGRVVVFAAVRAQALAGLGLDHAVQARAAQLVLVGGSITAEEAAARGWLLLPEPFSSEMVEEMLARLGA